MDPNTKDESPNRRREEALARRVGEALDQLAPRDASGRCLDPGVIAAYHEQALGPEETAHCELHFSDCARCRKVLAVLAATDDTPLAEVEVARLGELVAGARMAPIGALPPAVTIRPKRVNWRLRWLAPVLGVAAVLAVWFAMKPPWRNFGQGSSTILVAQAPKNETFPLPEDSPRSNSQVAPEGASESSKKQPAGKSEPGVSPSPLSAKNNQGSVVLDSLSSKDKNSPRAPAGEVVGQTEADNPAVASQSEASPSPVIAPQGSDSVATLTAPPSPDHLQGTSRTAPAAPNAITNSPMRMLRPAVPQAKMMSKIAAATEYFIVSPVPAESAAAGPGPVGSMWRAGKAGSIERSDDSGGTWHRQSSPRSEDWLGGVQVSKSVCWLAGRDGAIARTVDGEYWENVAPPSSSGDASGSFPDWVGITATSALTATIRASDQRQYRTLDGGKTWEFVQPN